MSPIILYELWMQSLEAANNGDSKKFRDIQQAFNRNYKACSNADQGEYHRMLHAELSRPFED